MLRIPFRVGAIAAGVSLFLVACGGSSDDSGSPAPASLSITGTAATGAALANATVTAKCASGTGTATTNTDGTYTVAVSGGTLPCVLEASGGGVTLHSVATGTVAQITPLTELLVAQVTGASPAALMASADIAALSTTFSANNVQAARTRVLAILGDAGIDASALASTDLLTGTLTVGAAGYDSVLDALGQALTGSGSTLDTLAGAVAAQAGSGPGTTSSTDSLASALPPDLLLKPASPTCSSLRSGNYWLVNSASTGGTAIEHLSVDAAAGTLTVIGTDDVRTLTANGTCRFSTDTGGDLVVSPAGVIVARGVDDGGDHFLGVAVPQQAHTPAEAAGDWNLIASDTNDDETGWVFGYGLATVATGASGTTIQFQKACMFSATATTPDCEASTTGAPAPVRPLTQDDGGGLVEHSAASGDGGPWADRSFVYRAGNGEWFMISANILTPDAAPNSLGDGSIAFATRARTLALPAVGSTSANWNVYMDTATQLSTNAIDASTHTIASVDANAGTFVRNTGSAGGATHPETLAINAPLAGFELRAGAIGVTTSDSGTTNVRQSYFLKVPGMGLSVLYQPVMTGVSNTPRLVVSVARP